MKDHRQKIDSLLNQATKLAHAQLIEICRQIMRRHKSLKECCIGMGSVAFYDSTGFPIDHLDKRKEAALDFACEYEYLRLSSIPARFTADSEVKFDW